MWMGGWMDGWIDGWVGGWVFGWMDELILAKLISTMEALGIVNDLKYMDGF